jgi:hypothetical protein
LSIGWLAFDQVQQRRASPRRRATVDPEVQGTTMHEQKIAMRGGLTGALPPDRKPPPAAEAVSVGLSRRGTAIPAR